jgi:hypothetical protein
MTKTYLYDVAFSFLARDEGTALALIDEVKDRVKCFIYSKEQKDLAGKAGDEAFGNVFGRQARVVVILYRKEWGTTPWTRVEETAIKNRGLEEGYDFTLLIPMEEKLETPIWFPKNRLWFGLETYGLKAAAGVIEARVVEQDGTVRELSTADKLNRILEDNAKAIERERFLSSEGYRVSNTEYLKVLELFRTELETVRALSPELNVRLIDRSDSMGNALQVIAQNRQLTINSSTNKNLAPLNVAMWRGKWPWLDGQVMDTKPVILKQWPYIFTLDAHSRYGWQSSTSNAFKLTTEVVGEVLIAFVKSAIDSKGEHSNLL